MNKVNKLIALIAELYSTEDGGTGGYGHIVFDDDNIEKHHIEWCIEESKKGKYDWICEDTRLASLKALEFALELTSVEVEEAINKHWNNHWS